jgi:tetratricopeptide (TPR) repeat protein
LRQVPNQALAQAERAEIRTELDSAMQLVLDRADQDWERGDASSAVLGWREVLRRDPGNNPALGRLREHATEIRERAQKLYLQGVEAYVQGRYEAALQNWQEALRFTPSETKLKEGVERARQKLEIIKK